MDCQPEYSGGTRNIPVWLCVCGFGLGLLLFPDMQALAGSNAPDTNTHYAGWMQFRAAIITNQSVVRYWTFESVNDRIVSGLVAGAEGDLCLYDMDRRDSREPFVEELCIVPGRWEGKHAVQLERGALWNAAYSNQGAGAFSFEGWMKYIGYVLLQPAADQSVGLVAAEEHYYSGWRLLLSSGVLCLEIGRPRPVGACALQWKNKEAATVSPGVWHHVVATWDNKEMALFLDGDLAGCRAYDGPYVRGPANWGFKVGRSGGGIGSARVVWDEIILYNRALTSAEIERHFRVCP